MEEFFNKTRICFGSGALAHLSAYRSRRCLVIADPFLVQSGMIGRVTEQLQEFEIFDQVVPDPPLELIVTGIQALLAYRPQALIAVGGGSAIDAAKAIRHFGRRTRELKEQPMLFLAIPTTSGTGSEVTSFAVITDPKKGVKYPLVDPTMRPDVAILDPQLVASVPAAIAADTGMDVLTHGLEAYVSTKATPFTDALALQAIRDVFQYLPVSVQSKAAPVQSGAAQGQTEAAQTEAPSTHAQKQPAVDPEEALWPRARMHYASCMAGLAFDAASLGLNHAIAHNIGGRFHVPHGRANAILLPHVVSFNAGISDYTQKEFSPAARKYAELAKLLGFGGMSVRTSVRNLLRQIHCLQQQVGIPQRFRDCGIEADQYQEAKQALIEGALSDACIATNPRTADRQEIAGILKQSY